MDVNLITAFDVDNEELYLSGVKIKGHKEKYNLSNNDLERRSQKIDEIKA